MTLEKEEDKFMVKKPDKKNKIYIDINLKKSLLFLFYYQNKIKILTLKIYI